MHHYNFPPFSVGETGLHARPEAPRHRPRRARPAGARADDPVAEDFPYTIRIVSETLESNGSSSMGSVCGSTLSLMDAGVPIKAPVGGIAMGLVKEGDDYVILTDIQGAEDHLGDMDFKVAGSRDGITALQMDIKITGVTQEIMRNALEQAKRARELDPRQDGRGDLRRPRTELAEHAPRISTVKIDPEKIGMVIGKGGETIRALEADYEVQIDIEEDGTILIYATEGTKARRGDRRDRGLTKEPEVGDTYTGKVVKTTDFGAFVELTKGTDGLLHVSNVGPRPGRPHRGRDRARRRARRDRPGGRQGARPDRPQARRQARERVARPARGADRAGEGRPAARAARSVRAAIAVTAADAGGRERAGRSGDARLGSARGSQGSARRDSDARSSSASARSVATPSGAARRRALAICDPAACRSTCLSAAYDRGRARARSGERIPER